METKEFMNKIEELKQDIKGQLKQVTNQGRTNAKLYDASYIGKDKAFEGEYSPFYRFCQIEWDFFRDFMKENNLNTQQYARTSSFYIVSTQYTDDRSFSDYNNLSELDEPQLEKAVIEFMDNHLFYEKRNDETLTFNDVEYLIGYFMNQYELTLEESFEYIQESVIDSIEDELIELEKYVKSLESVNEGYDYLNQFKENQVYNFISYIQDELENGYLDGFLVDYIDLDEVKEKYPTQYGMFLTDTGFTHEQLINAPQVAQLNEELETIQQEYKDNNRKKNEETLKVGLEIVRGYSAEWAIDSLKGIVEESELTFSKLYAREKEIKGQLLELS